GPRVGVRGDADLQNLVLDAAEGGPEHGDDLDLPLGRAVLGGLLRGALEGRLRLARQEGDPLEGGRLVDLEVREHQVPPLSGGHYRPASWSYDPICVGPS